MLAETIIPTHPAQKGWLDRTLWKSITPAILLLVAIMLLSTVLHFINLDQIGNANAYYTAAVKSMLQSWHNFFYAAAEPGGSVSVDKPALGLWIETAFAYVFGLSGFVVSLPNILAGILGIPLLYHLVKKYLGTLAGLIAALVYAITPVVLATDRNNTMDGMLVFVLLLAAWAFIKATATGKLRWLLLGSVFVGLGFNIKMLQAFLPLPAFYALYFLGSKVNWNRKLVQLTVATVVLLVVSLSWAVAVDLTPADQRPYVGSSTTNSELDLILGYNGINRLLGNQSGAQPSGNLASTDQTRLLPFDNGYRQPPVAGDNGYRQPPFDGYFGPRPDALPGNDAQPGFPPDRLNGAAGQNGVGGIFGKEVGQASILRFFTAPLGVQMSWLLPFALISLILLVFSTRLHWPLDNEHKAWVLWGGWLLTCLVFFSMAGFFHAYYMIMLAPALGAVVGAGVKTVWERRQRSWVLWTGLVAVLLTVIFEAWLALHYYGNSWGWLAMVAMLTIIGGLGLVVTRWISARGIQTTAIVLLVTAMLITPLAWSVLTVMDQFPGMNLPTAFRGGNDQQPGALARVNNPPMDGAPADTGMGLVQTAMLDYLEANTKDIKYLLAVPSANVGKEWVLATGRPVLYMGGFSGNDAVVNAASLAALVKNGELRYVLMSGNQGSKPGITTWLNKNCTIVTSYSSNTSSTTDPSRSVSRLAAQVSARVDGNGSLYQCLP